MPWAAIALLKRKRLLPAQRVDRAFSLDFSIEKLPDTILYNDVDAT